jgi:MFS family permease
MNTNWSVIFRFNGNIRRYLACQGLAGFAYFGIQGVLLNLYLLRLGYSTEFIGILMASGQIVWAVLALPAGEVGRRVGLRGAFVLGFLLWMLSTTLLLQVELLPDGLRAGWLFSTWMVMWTGVALISVNALPYVMAVAGEGERSHVLAANAVVMPAMVFAGSVVAGLLPTAFAAWLGASMDDPAPYRLALWLVPLCLLLCVLIWATSTPVSVLEVKEDVTAAKAPWLLFIFLGVLVVLQSSSDGVVRAFFNVYLDTDLQVPTAYIGAIMGTGQLIPMFVALFVPAILARWGVTQTLTWTGVGIAVSLLPLAFFPLWPLATLGFMGVLSVVAVNGIARGLFLQEIVTPRWRVTTSAILAIGMALGWAVTAGAGGYLAAAIGFRNLFLVVVPLPLLSSILMWAYVRRQARPPQLAPVAETPVPHP